MGPVDGRDFRTASRSKLPAWVGAIVRERSRGRSVRPHPHRRGVCDRCRRPRDLHEDSRLPDGRRDRPRGVRWSL